MMCTAMTIRSPSTFPLLNFFPPQIHASIGTSSKTYGWEGPMLDYQGRIARHDLHNRVSWRKAFTVKRNEHTLPSLLVFRTALTLTSLGQVLGDNHRLGFQLPS